ncbi:extracellular serine-threonine rich protein [Arthroderma uncinatum]|uniref:extracellular serine-threonine rich protein n=1 Tax=Arthroderma uncinatum TaxID=74035 RepID=UPI00144ADFAA|nr:extracellular serine-threonine rich protein [Arthroderma uncinatum]KAF3484073.1 extracellular serine-threonine rich protein [Arthroderma uncinatum]
MKFTLIVAAFAAVVSAVTPPDVSKPAAGNIIYTPGLNQQVEAGKPFTITWKPTTKGKISILLLRGPSINVKPIATLADSIENTGTFNWIPSTSLENDVTHYGIQIIVEGTGQYQYSTQFGVKNDTPLQPKPSAPATPTWTGRQPTAPVTHIAVPVGTGTTVPTGVVTLTTSVCPPSSTQTQAPGVPHPTGTGVPTGVPPPPPPGATTTTPPFNNGAGRVSGGVGAALLAIAAAFAL